MKSIQIIYSSHKVWENLLRKSEDDIYETLM